MHIKFRKKLFFIVAFIVICFTLSNRAALSQAGGSISISKDIYYVGDVIRINYTSIPGDRNKDGWYTGIKYQIAVNSVEGKFASRHFDVKSTTSGVWELDTKDTEGSWIARDLTVTLHRWENNTDTTLVTKHIRLRQSKYERIPGALSLLGGSRFNHGDPLLAGINLPSSFDEDISNGTIFILLYFLNRQTHGGAIQPDHNVTSYMQSSIVTSLHGEGIALNKNNLIPGIYELRLMRWAGDSKEYSYVIDSVRFEMVHEHWPGSLKVLSLDDFKVGDEIKVQLDSGAVPFKDIASSPFYNRLEVHIYRVGSEIGELSAQGRYRRIDGVYLEYLGNPEEVVSADQDIIFRPVKQAGKYVIILQTNHLSDPLYADGYSHSFKGYILDHLFIDIDKAKEVAPSWSDSAKEQFDNIKKQYPAFEIPIPRASSHIGTGNKIRFIVGEKIPIEVFMPSDQRPGGTTVVSLKANDPDAGFNHGEPVGEQIKEWDVEVGKKKAWTIPGDLTIGTYNLVLKTNYIAEGDRKAYSEVAGVTSFQVIPEINAVIIGIQNKRTFSYGEKITFDVIFPESINSEDFKFHYSIMRKGGFVPGCAKMENYIIAGDYIKNGLKNISFITPPPGKYALKIYGYLRDGLRWQTILLLAEESFSSDLPWQPGALSFSSQKAEFLHGEEIHVIVDAHADLGFVGGGSDGWSRYSKKIDEIGKYMLYLIRQGDAGYGGVSRYPAPREIFIKKIVAAKDNFILKKSELGYLLLLPGAYEFRLYNMLKDLENSFLVSRLPFYVTEPGSPFPTEKGNPSVPQPSDLEFPGDFSGLRIGDFLTAETCRQSSLKPTVEKMVLSFVQWDEAQHKYVPIEGALEFGQSFYIEGKLEKEASSNFYAAEIKSSSGRVQEVILWTDEDDNTVVRSERLYAIWEDTGGGE